MGNHDHRHNAFVNQRAVGHQLDLVQLIDAAIDGGQRLVWVNSGAPQARKVFEGTDDAARRQTLKIGAAHRGDQGGIRAEGAINQPWVIGIGEDIHNGHEIDVESQRRRSWAAFSPAS